MSAPSRRTLGSRFIAVALWTILLLLGLAWTAFLWHPWIDWFGRPR